MLASRPEGAEAKLSFAALGDLLDEAFDDVAGELPSPHGSDRAFGGAGDDDLGAVPGANNVLRREAGDDELDALNGQRDDVDGGPGRDRALVDALLDLVRRAEDLLRR